MNNPREELRPLSQGNAYEFNMEFNYPKPKQKVEPDAEENAHELLKTMLTKKEFVTYRDEGFVMVKGTYGRTYKVIKGNMIQVTQKRGKKTKNYRLCIEPRDYGTICPTDEVIAKIKLIKASEKMLHKIGNRFDGGEYEFGAASMHFDSCDGQVLSYDGNDSISFIDPPNPTDWNLNQ
jgi:hypothetical protein